MSGAGLASSVRRFKRWNLMRGPLPWRLGAFFFAKLFPPFSAGCQYSVADVILIVGRTRNSRDDSGGREGGGGGARRRGAGQRAPNDREKAAHGRTRDSVSVERAGVVQACKGVIARDSADFCSRSQQSGLSRKERAEVAVSPGEKRKKNDQDIQKVEPSLRSPLMQP